MEIVSVLLFILVLMSGSFFAAYKFDKPFEETFPISCLSYIIIGFIIGILNILKISVPIIIVFSLALYAYTIYEVVKNKDLDKIINNIFTPGFVIFIGFTFIFVFALKGKLFNTNDEFSHWGDIVKVMATIEDFGTNPLSNSIFKSYPPAVSIFQYILEKINLYLTGEVFVEWLCYIAYDILCVTVILPFTNKFSFKRSSSIITSIITLFLLPFIFFTPSFITLHVETILSFFIAALALQLIWNEDDLLSDIRYLLMLAVLVIVKDSGLLFSALFGIGFALKKLLNKDLTKKEKLLNCLYTACAIGLPKVLWAIDIKINHVAKSFSNKFDFISLLNVLTGKEISYRKDVLKTFFDYTMVEGMFIGKTGIMMIYSALIVILICLIIIVTSLIKTKYEEKKTSSNIAKYISIITLIVFIAGTCVSYMYKFSEDEALQLASYERYVSIVYIGFFLFVFINFIILNDRNDKLTEVLNCVIICVLVFCVPAEIVTTIFTRTVVKSSIAYRNELCGEIVNKTNELLNNETIWYINVYSDDADRLVYKYSVRPNVVEGYANIKEKVKDDDQFAIKYSVDEWSNDLFNGNCGYVAIYRVNDEFIEDYGSLFENIEDISDNTLFKVNKDTKTLTLCE